jgi:hypothetical protein
LEKRLAKIKTEGQDFLGNKLIVGDLVAFTESETCKLALARVEGFTPKMIKVDIIHLEGVTTSVGGRGSYSRLVNRTPAQLIKIPNNEEYFKDLPKTWIAKLFNNNRLAPLEEPDEPTEE